MTELKRVAYVLGIMLSIVGMALGMAGVVGIWAVNGPITKSALAVLAPIEATLASVEVLSGEASQLMSSVAESVTTVRSRVASASAEIASADRTLETVSQIVTERVGPALDLLQAGGELVRDAADGLEKATARLDRLPLIQVELPAVEKLRTVQRDVTNTVSDLEILKQAATTEQTGPLGTAFSLVSSPVVELDEKVQAARGKVEQLSDQVGDAHDTVSMLLVRLPLWIDLASIALTLLLVWFAVSQIAVYKLCRLRLSEYQTDDELIEL